MLILISHAHIYTVTHLRYVTVCASYLLLGVAEVIAEVVVAWQFGNDWGVVRYGDVLEVQEAELNLHREENLQLAAHGFTTHVPAEENV